MNLYPPPFKNSFSNIKQMFFSHVWEQWFYSLKAVIDSLIEAVLNIPEGESDIIASGVAFLVDGEVTVNNSLVSSTNNILVTVQSLGTVTTPKSVCVTNKTPSSSFTITSEDDTDTSTVFWAIVSSDSVTLTYKIPITCNHLYVDGTYTDFPCQINLSYILSSYPNIKDAISTTSDINVIDSEDNYLPVYIDLDKLNDKLIVYFSGTVDNVSDKTFYVTIGYESSVNSYDVFSNYYNRYWGLNSATDTPTTDICLASGYVLNKNSCTFGNNSLFYKGGKSSALVYAHTSAIPALVSAASFSIHLRFQKQDYSGGYAFFIRQAESDVNATSINTSGQYLYIVITKIPLVKLAYIDTSGWSINEWYDVWFVVNLNELSDINKGKVYVNGYQVGVTFVDPWSGLTSTHSYNSTAKLMGESIGGSYNPSIIDSIGVCSGVVSSGFILTSANQYLNSNFWSVGSILT